MVIRDSNLKAYERQALRYTIRIVRSNPHTVKSVLQIHAMKQSRLQPRPQCHCGSFHGIAEQFGTTCEVAGHKSVRPDDHVPILGEKQGKRQLLVSKTSAPTLMSLSPLSSYLLPKTVFPGTGTLLKQL